MKVPLELEKTKTIESRNSTTLPGNAGQWSPGRRTEPFCDGNSDDCIVSETKKQRHYWSLQPKYYCGETINFIVLNRITPLSHFQSLSLERAGKWSQSQATNWSLTPTCVLSLLRRSGYESKAPIATANSLCTRMSEYLWRKATKGSKLTKIKWKVRVKLITNSWCSWTAQTFWSVRWNECKLELPSHNVEIPLQGACLNRSKPLASCIASP